MRSHKDSPFSGYLSSGKSGFNVCNDKNKYSTFLKSFHEYQPDWKNSRFKSSAGLKRYFIFSVLIWHSILYMTSICPKGSHWIKTHHILPKGSQDTQYLFTIIAVVTVLDKKKIHNFRQLPPKITNFESRKHKDLNFPTIKRWKSQLGSVAWTVLLQKRWTDTDPLRNEKKIFVPFESVSRSVLQPSLETSFLNPHC